MNSTPIEAMSKPRMRVAMLKPISPNNRRKNPPESRITSVTRETPTATPTSPQNTVALLASPAYRIKLAMTPGPTSSGHRKRNDDLAIDRLSLPEHADLRCDHEILRLIHRILCDGADPNQQQKYPTGDAESIQRDAKEIKQRCARKEEHKHQSQHSD